MKIKSIISLFLLPVFLLLQIRISAQDSTAYPYADVSSVKVVKQLSKISSSSFVSPDTDAVLHFKSLVFKNGTQYSGPVPDKMVPKTLFLKFNITNSADSAINICFFPGFFYTAVDLYSLRNGEIKSISATKPQNTDSYSFRMFSVQPHDSFTMVVKLKFAKTYLNTIRPRLISPDQIDFFIATIRDSHTNIHIFTYIFCGLLLMMILFSVSSFLQGANREFLYYALYAFFSGSMLFTKAYYDFRATELSIFLESYLDFIMQSLGVMFYLIFMQRFLNTKTQHPFLYKFYNAGIILIGIATITYTILHYFTGLFYLQNTVETITKILLLVMIIIFLFYSFRHWNNILFRYLFWGNLLLFIFSLISQVAVLFDKYFNTFPGIFSSSLFYYEIGLFLELVLFLAGLNYKNNRRIIEETKERENLKAQNKLQEYEKQLAVLTAQQQERERISADMHDELGAGMTAIRLMSEIARNKMKENTPVEIEKISNSANDVLNKMNAIIWSMNSGNDTIDNLISYIRSYANEYFENTPIGCKIYIPENIPALTISGDKRRNLFLCIKETLNNALKHSEATGIEINISIAAEIKVVIADNGKGINKETLRQFGNGLKNIARRMESIGGSFTIENNNGTVTTLILPV